MHRIAFVMVGVLASAGRAEAGKAAVEVSSPRVSFDREDGKYDLTLAFDALFVKKPASGYEVTVKSRCEVEGRSRVDASSAIDTLEDIDAGDTKAMSVLLYNLMGDNAMPAAPTQCELTVRYGKLFGTPKPVATFCWDGQAVNAGACVPAHPVKKGAITVDAPSVLVGQDGSKRDVTMGFTVTFGKKPSKGSEVTVNGRCVVAGKKRVDTSSAMDTLDDLDVGDSKALSVILFNLMGDTPLPGDPASCELAVRYGAMFGGPPKTLATFCWRPDSLVTGKCP